MRVYRTIGPLVLICYFKSIPHPSKTIYNYRPTHSLHTKSCKVATTKSRKVAATRSCKVAATKSRKVAATKSRKVVATEKHKVAATKSSKTNLHTKKFTSGNYAATSCSN